MRKAVIGALAICFAAILWGLDGVVLTPQLSNLSVPFVVFLIHLIPFLGMQPFLWKSYPKLWRMKWQGWLALFLVAVTGGLLGTLAIVKAIFIMNFQQHLSVVVLLQKLQPLFAILLAALLLKERLRPGFFGWALLAIVGAYLLTFGFRAPNGAPIAASIWAIIAAASFGSATVFGKQLVGHLNFKESTFARYGITTILATIYLLVGGIWFPFMSITRLNWLIILIIALTTGSLAIFIYYYGLTRVKASISTICELCLPLSAVIFDWLINGSVLNAGQWIGVLLLITAILMITRQAPVAQSS